MEENQKELAGRPGENGHETENDSIIPDEVLERIPQKERKEFIQTITKVAGVFSPQNPLIKKITPDHISTLTADSNVAFYFIATQETNPDYKKMINKFLAEKKYDFEVLYDGYNPESKHLDIAYARCAKDYHSSGIPMKLIIDQQGKLRWVNNGYKTSPSALADEISFIIETLKKEEASTQTTGAVTTTASYY